MRDVLCSIAMAGLLSGCSSFEQQMPLTRYQKARTVAQDLQGNRQGEDYDMNGLRFETNYFYNARGDILCDVECASQDERPQLLKVTVYDTISPLDGARCRALSFTDRGADGRCDEMRDFDYTYGAAWKPDDNCQRLYEHVLGRLLERCR